MIRKHGDVPTDGERTGSLELRVGEAASKDVGRAIARLDPADLARLGLSIGDTVALRGKRQTVCKAMPAFVDDRGQARVHIDGLTRENAGVGIDDAVTIESAPCAPAESITLKPVSVAPLERDMEYIGSLLDGLPVVAGDRIRATLFGSRSADFVVERTSPAGTPVLINPTTALTVTRGGSGSKGEPRGAAVSYEDIGGLRGQLQRIRETIELPLRYPEVFETLGIDPPKGVLLHGPPGCGKTLIARAIAHETEANFYVVSGPEIVHKFYGESEAHLRKIWDEATRKGPSIIFIDEIDSIAPKRETTQGEVEKRIVAQLLALMDGLNKRAGVMVIAATNLPNNIDPALRRPGRFDREIEIPIPDKRGRREILDVHSRGMPLAEAVELERIAEITHGCVGADLEALCREAAMACLRSIMSEIDFGRAQIPYEQLAALEVTMDHFAQAMNEVTPSAMREVFVEVPDVSWADIGGLEDVKRRLIEAVEWPLKHGALFDEAGVKPPKGILLAGPPGVGKTLLAKATARQSGANFISVKGPELMSRFVGDSEKGLRDVFRKARQASPCVIFFDEIDALIPRRGGGGGGGGDQSGVSDRVLSQFLAEMDGVEELRGVLVLGATNRLDMLDPAVVRPGRFDEIVELDHPDEAGRRAIFAVHLAGRPLADGLDAAALASELASRAHGASGAQASAICDVAARAAVRRAVDRLRGGAPAAPGEGGGVAGVRIERADFDAAISEVLGL